MRKKRLIRGTGVPVGVKEYLDDVAPVNDPSLVDATTGKSTQTQQPVQMPTIKPPADEERKTVEQVKTEQETESEVESGHSDLEYEPNKRTGGTGKRRSQRISRQQQEAQDQQDNAAALY